jgi:hypothetical protein
MQPPARRRCSILARDTHSRRCAALVAPLEFKSPDAFALGATSTNVCPSGTVALPSSASCEVAAAVAGRPYGGSFFLSWFVFEGRRYIPVGCVWWAAGGSFYFNTATSGLGYPMAQPVCAGAPPFNPEGNDLDLNVYVSANVRLCLRLLPHISKS